VFLILSKSSALTGNKPNPARAVCGSPPALSACPAQQHEAGLSGVLSAEAFLEEFEFHPFPGIIEEDRLFG
jgi:hypothetical protein